MPPECRILFRRRGSTVSTISLHLRPDSRADDRVALVRFRARWRWPRRDRRCRFCRAPAWLWEAARYPWRARKARRLRRSKLRTGSWSEDVRGTRSSFHSLEPAGEPGGGNVHREAFQGKRNKAEIAGRGHLEDLRPLEHGK